ncbi:ankyrin repeat domain-containing protein 53 [Onychomys torridus]|uniref:ankyrin repeat domain-containing protein 53 n=1 Tax=Onychomys torridus TaxID=38674 RepID=UPI00167FCE8A|nr:ankyrin repeat domain-containing protein 53 [Onychomys torridus]
MQLQIQTHFVCVWHRALLSLGSDGQLSFPILAGAKSRGGATRGTGVGRVPGPSQPCAHSLGSSNARATSVSVASRRRRTGSWHSGKGSGRKEQSCSAAPGSTQQTEHTLQKGASSDAESWQPSPSELSNYKAIPSYSELFAASVGNVDWLRFCLNRERKEITVDDKGFTAIHFAAQRSKLSCLQVLIEEYKFPVDLPTNNGQTPLHLLIHKGNKSDILPCIDYLLKKGAAINSKTCHGSTPLHLAARNGLLGCMKVLVQSGANVHAQDAMGCKPIDYCKLWNHRSCARFLKDAMWKQNKKDFAREMGKLKTLKRKLAILERCYLTEYQKEQQILREAHFRTWLQGKLLSRPQSSADPKQEAGVQPWSLALSTTLRSQFIKSFPTYPSVEAQLQSLPSPVVTPKPIYKHQSTISRPKLWNLSNNPVSSPVTKIDCPQGIRLGVHPDPSKEHDFCRFVEVTRNSLGGACLYTVDNHSVTPVPRLPFEVMVRALYPRAQPYRMKVPQGLYPLDILKVPQKRHLGNTCSNALAMSLRETFDEPFLATLKACPTGVAPPSKGVLT